MPRENAKTVSAHSKLQKQLVSALEAALWRLEKLDSEANGYCSSTAKVRRVLKKAKAL